MSALIAFGVIITGAPMGAEAANAKLYEMRSYHANPGKMEAVHARFRDHACRLLKKHGMDPIGFWVPADAADAGNGLLIWILAWPDRQTRDNKWAEFMADPEWQKAFNESEKDGKLVEKAVIHFLSPTDFSMSVHNTVAGLTTITAGLPMPATSLAAGEDGLQAGLMEACAWLGCQDAPVLVLCFDGQVPAFYQPWVDTGVPPYAVGMLLTRGSQWRYRGSTAGTTGASALPQPLQFLRSWLKGESACLLDAGAQQRCWQC